MNGISKREYNELSMTDHAKAEPAERPERKSVREPRARGVKSETKNKKQDSW